jgi:hypothetical protein
MQFILFDRAGREEANDIRIRGGTSRAVNHRLIFVVVRLPEDFSSSQPLISAADQHEAYSIEYSSSS